ncbi:MAG TPA: hypothetical protein VHA52_12635 [Candidatus Babeliaceae bacterium]|nr:hypothetical protein [Candidatus Babeliaceae bacterium]
MKTTVKKRVTEWLLQCHVDRNRTVTGYHVDDLDYSLKIDKKKWYKESLELFRLVLLTKERLQLPWHISLSVYLKNRRKNLGLNFYSIPELQGAIDPQTPPEYIVYAEKPLFQLPYYPLDPNNYEFIPKLYNCFFYESYSPEIRSFLQSLQFILPKKRLFDLMVKSIATQNCDRYLTVTQNTLDKAITLLFCDKPKELAKELLEQTITQDPTSIKAYFWLSIYYYYCVDDKVKSQELLRKAIDINPGHADLFAFLFRVSWDSSNDQEHNLYLIEKAIQLQPTWILPRLQLARFLATKREYILAEKELLGLPDLPKSCRSNDIANNFYHNFVTGCTKEHQTIIKLFLKLIRKWQKYSHL